MRIPQRFRELLADHPLYPCVISSLDEFEPWLSAERPPFFPEYTNHGVSHIEGVFQTAEALIRDDAWAVLTPSDAAVIVLSILLHDSAMHLTPDSFAALLSQCNSEYLVKGLDTESWTQAWDEFLSEASRFDGRRLHALFGDAEPVHRPCLDPHDMTQRDMKVIGEFLRRHHHRLAHQIALFGVPGPEHGRLALRNVPADIADLAGLVARSHGMAVRGCVEYLAQRYNNRCEYQGVHAAFLMTLLRVADYLQIQPARAPAQVTRVLSLRSPLSRGHWSVHEAIRDVRITHPDPEAIDVYAMPNNVDTFLRIKELVEAIQVELDSSWALLGEVYGRMKDNNLHLFGFKYRRIRSNLDDTDAFAKQVPYIPAEVAFESAGADLLKLLVKPLYGGNPAYGIRELIQNAVDAVREREEYEKRHPIQEIDLPDQEADVLVSLDKDGNGDLWLTVSDKGIGMTVQTVRDYFLRAGASFRYSDAWKRAFTDEAGKSLVLRSGRFGIGALAAFLLADTIEVTTRHILSPRDGGVYFRAGLEDERIHLVRASRSVGTTIRMKIAQDLRDKYSLRVLDWDAFARTWEGSDSWHLMADWYCLAEPRVEITINGAKAPPRFSLPTFGSDLSPGWRRFTCSGFDDVHWTYSASAPPLACNGIPIGSKEDPRHPDASRDTAFLDDILVPGTYFPIPRLSVSDADGNLPLNLERNGLNAPIPFLEKLRREVIIAFLTQVLVRGLSAHLSEKSGYNELRAMAYGGGPLPCPYFANSTLSLAPWFCTKDGFSLIDPSHIRQSVNASAILMVHVERRYRSVADLTQVFTRLHTDVEAPPIPPPFVPLPESNCFLFWRTGWTEAIPWMQFARFALTSSVVDGSRATSRTLWPEVRASRVLLPKTSFEQLCRNYGLGKNRRAHLKVETEKANWLLVGLGPCPDATQDLLNVFAKVGAENPQDCPTGFAEWYFDNTSGNCQSAPFASIAEVWHEVIRSPIIPYDQKRRRDVLAHAFDELSPYIEAYVRSAAEGNGGRPSKP